MAMALNEAYERTSAIGKEKVFRKKELCMPTTNYTLPPDISSERFAEWLDIEKKLDEIGLKDVEAANALVKNWKIVEMKRMMEITGRKSRVRNYLSVGNHMFQLKTEKELFENIFE